MESFKMVALPALADLHRHLDGSLRMGTLQAFAKELGVTIPSDLRFYKGMGLRAALERFSVTLSLLQRSESVTRVAAEICEDALEDGVTKLEIRFAPQLHGSRDSEIIVDAALEGINGRAGLILCGLYGEVPDVLHDLVKIAETRPGVVGIDLAGGPVPEHRYGMADYAPAFKRAADLGLGRTVHAGEGRPPQEIIDAIVLLKANRIGHGTTLLSSERALQLVLEQEITIEACPTSNMHTGAIGEIAEHPIINWLKRGVKVCICPDNTLLSDVTSSEEHLRSLSIPGMDIELLELTIMHGHNGVFLRRV
jgi:adenosine deaminase